MNPYTTNQYQQNQIATASPEQILLMLYDGAIRFLRKAMAGIEASDEEAKRYGISKCMAIVSELSNSLNYEIGGKIAEDLDGLYAFMMREMTDANLSGDLDKLRVVETLLMDLRETWGEAVEINKKEKAATASTSKGNAPDPANYTPLTVSS
jgi:flagellar protein FliS